MFSKRFIELHQKVRYTCGVIPKVRHNAITSNATVHLFQRCPPLYTVRHASTNTVVPPVITKAIEAATPAGEGTSPSTSIESVIESIGPIPEAPGLPIPKAIELLSNGEPSLTSLGLGGYSPIGILQHILENFHVTTDLSWGYTIVIVAAVIRVLCFKLVVRQRQESAKFASVMPQLTYLQQKMSEARQQNDLIQASRYAMELQEFGKSNPSMFGPLKYGLAQGIVLLSFTQALREMCNLPVESLKTGGFGPVIDLTRVDPTMVLPFINGALMYLHLATGRELYEMFPTKSRVFIQACMGAAGTLLFVISMNFQGAIVLYWISSQCVTIVQHKVLKQPKVRAYYQLDVKGRKSVAEMMQKDKMKQEQNKTSKLGFIARMREAQTNNRLADEVKRRADLDSAAFERAGREPLQKTYKYDITKMKK
ncbi:hypothetical protein ONE63_001307 [Megalurothrips usitatus]|uniref:Membrane insertase YidC/Oxa/ALB C-terminal domain-containing protein n=1 Tax=Megalurothrips usitatus TaxID=439358 RepID=A0AAV7XFT2_9NEOP|nr:hypothetical protein ONE63_001307 [Megalurothrips usitatus]